MLPAGTTFVSAVDAAGGIGSFFCSEAGGLVDCAGGILDGTLDLVPGAGPTPTILINVTAPLVHGQTLTNQAFIDPLNAIPEADETNNFASDTTLVESQINLTLTKSGPHLHDQGPPAFDVAFSRPGLRAQHGARF